MFSLIYSSFTAGDVPNDLERVSVPVQNGIQEPPTSSAAPLPLPSTCRTPATSVDSHANHQPTAVLPKPTNERLTSEQRLLSLSSDRLGDRINDRLGKQLSSKSKEFKDHQERREKHLHPPYGGASTTDRVPSCHSAGVHKSLSSPSLSSVRRKPTPSTPLWNPSLPR